MALGTAAVVCGRRGCGNVTVYAAPSVARKYCSKECRYSDPELREYVGQKVLHKITNSDGRYGDCSLCGPHVLVLLKCDPALNKYPRADGVKTYKCYSVARRLKTMLTRHGLDADQQLQWLNAQTDYCPICLREFDDNVVPFFDHDHSTNEPRGLLCSQCNTGLGYFYDRQESLRRAVEYLDRYQARDSR